MSKSYGVQARLVLGFSIAPVIMAVLIVVGVQRVNSVDHSLAVINDVNSVKQRYAINFRGSVHDRAISLRDVVLGASKEESEKAIAEIKTLEDFYKESAGPLDKIFLGAEVTDTEKKLLADIKAIEAETLPVIQNVVKLYRDGQGKEAHDLLMGTAKPLFKTWLGRINKFIDYQEAANVQESKTARDIAHGFERLMYILAGVGISLAAFMAYLIVRSIVPPLRLVTSQLDVSSEQIADVSQVISRSSLSLSEGAAKQAASIEEIGASIEELTSMTKMNAQNADAGKQASNEARLVAEAGAREMEQMKRAMDAIQQSSNEISVIMNTIDDIAFQTNLLALNAAVEAARAGEQGKGFAVVANEVRNLAQRSADAAKETAQKIQSALERSSQGVELSQKVMKGFEQILEKNRQVDNIVTEVAQASKEQSDGFAQITTAIMEMDRVTQTNAKLAAENSQTLGALNIQSQEIREASESLLQLVGSSGGELKKAA